ncbi:MAG: hypothetical protein LBK52_00595, partial [Deltaproteobacteria bacterium]|nr:hypothetical protein [Deltaproteobacteria bacterium]
IVSLLAEKTRLFLEKPGQSLKMVFEYDPAKAGDILADCFKPARETARACRLELGSVLDSWEKTLASQAGGENLWLVLWTKSDILEAGARKKSQKNHFNALGAVLGWPGQKEGIGLPELRQAHRGTITALREALTDSGLLNRTLPARELLRDIRSALFPDLTPPVWEAWLPGDRRPFILPETNEKLETLLTFPRLSEQLFPHQAVIWKRDFVILGDRLHAPFFLAVPPREPKPFNELFRSLSRHRYPWRLACDLSSGDPGQWSLDSLLARIFGLTSVKNRLLQGALENLKALRNQGAALVGVSFCLDTWVEILRYPSLAAAENALRRQLAELERLLSGWGQTTLQLVTGDPLLGVCGALPGLIRKTPAPRALAPLEEAFSFLPLRPASAWNRGPLVFLSPDGKPLPFWPNSSAQAAWIDLGVAPMGSGKSVLLNTLNLAFCLQPGLDELPLLSVIDVGPSSMGLIALLKNALPPHLKPQAAGCRLRPTPEYSINPLDTPLGLRSPLPGH